ncbi:MAG: class I SAM-dependent methyltransferase [Candidatus Aenigmarchaeota archaeon]|nr:class I SAM-dependent methyltransferase [Candidatus Aenigmarchaeota archaeon]
MISVSYGTRKYHGLKNAKHGAKRTIVVILRLQKTGLCKTLSRYKTQRLTRGCETMKEHWNKVYSSRDTTRLGWYEESPEKSLELIDKCNTNEHDKILDVGSGASTLIDNLISRGYKNIIATDISIEALEKLKQRLGDDAQLVKWIVDDLAHPKHLNDLKDITIWHDRAVLHFLTEESERQTYLLTLQKIVKNKGYVIIASFSLDGASKCSGLDVRRYDENMLQEFLGNGFKLLEHCSYLYHMPSGDKRPYIYALFQRI